MEFPILSAWYFFETPERFMWRVPVRVIATNRAEYYKKEFGGDALRSLEEDTAPLFTSCPDEIIDWARNNMDWSDVRDNAECVVVNSASSEMQDVWVNPENPRILQHREKDFDSYTYIPCERSDLDRLESIYIHTSWKRLNKKALAGRKGN